WLLLPGRLDLPSSQNFSRPARAGWITFLNPAGDFKGGYDPLGVFRQVLHGSKQIVLLLWILVRERCDRLSGTPGHDAVDRQSDKVARYAVVGGGAICACKRAWPVAQECVLPELRPIGRRKAAESRTAAERSTN